MPTERTHESEGDGRADTRHQGDEAKARDVAGKPGEEPQTQPRHVAGEGDDAESSAEVAGSGGARRSGGRGFAGMDPAKQREIASKGGKAAHAKGTAHEFTSEEARIAGRKGGQAGGGVNRGFAGMDPAKQREIASKGGKAAHAKGTAHEFTSEEARAAGKKGGEASAGGRGRQPKD